MIAAELYRKTLAGYEASLERGERISLSKYCKTHYVSRRGLSYWMKKHSIIPPRPLKFTGSSSTPCTKKTETDSHPVIPTSGWIPLVVQSPTCSEEPTPMKPSLKDVDLTTVSGIVVHINEISPADLAELILTCNTR